MSQVQSHRSRVIFSILSFVIYCFLTPQAMAHDTSTAYVNIQLNSTSQDSLILTGQLKIDLRDLQQIINLDINQNGQLSWGELLENNSKIVSILAKHVLLSSSKPCPIHYTATMIESILNKNYVVFPFIANCPAKQVAFQLSYNLIFNINQRHKALIKFTSDKEQFVAILEHKNKVKRYTLHNANTNSGTTLIEFISQGVWHIWIGFDHILFLLSLLLPAIMQRDNGQWLPQNNWKSSTISVLKIVSAFTLAHSITLTLAAFNLITLSPVFIETAIALSVVIAALNNIKLFLPFSRVYVAFIFGLIHGFGFANVLTELNLQTTNFVYALLGFNLGVEFGQLVIVAVFLPVGIKLSRWRIYPRVILPYGSLAIAFLGLLWIAERGFELQILPA